MSNCFIQYDLYHMQVMESNLIDRIPEIIDRIGHFQFSDVPDRTEPGLGIIEFERVFDLIDSLGFHRLRGRRVLPHCQHSRYPGLAEAVSTRQVSAVRE